MEDTERLVCLGTSQGISLVTGAPLKSQYQHWGNQARALWGSWAHKPFCVSHFLFLGNKLQPPGPSPSSKGSPSSGKGGDAETGRGAGGGGWGVGGGGEVQSGDNSAALGQSLASSSKNLHDNIFEPKYLMNPSFFIQGRRKTTRTRTGGH